MNTYQTKNRKNGFITALAAAAAVAALGLATTTRALATTTDTNNWIGPAGNGSQGGAWEGNGGYWSEGWIPGTNGANGYVDNPYIMGGANNSTGITVTVGSSYAADAAYLGTLHVNSGYNGSTNNPNSPVTLNINTGANLPTGLILGGSGTYAYGATVNVDGGTISSPNTILVGAGVSSSTTGQTASTLNVTSGGTVDLTSPTSNPTGDQWGFNVGSNGSNGVLNVSGTGQINDGYPGSIVLGTSAPVTNTHGTFVGSGTLNQSGGTITVNRDIFVGFDTVGAYNMSAGTANIGGLDVGAHGAGTMNLSGTSVINAGGVSISDAITNQGVNGGASGTPGGLLSVTGGTINAGRLTVGNTNTTNQGAGELQVVGNAGNLIFKAGAGSSAMQTLANSTLDFQIGSGGVSTITADGGGTTSATSDGRDVVALSGLLQLDLLNGFTPAHGATYTLISTNVLASTYSYTNASGDKVTVTLPGIVTGAGVDLPNYNNNYHPSGLAYPDPGTYITNTGLSLAAVDDGLWSFNVVVNPAGTATELQATYIGASPPIPEPSSVALLAAAGAGLLLLGRRRRPA